MVVEGYNFVQNLKTKDKDSIEEEKLTFNLHSSVNTTRFGVTCGFSNRYIIFGNIYKNYYRFNLETFEKMIQ